MAFRVWRVSSNIGFLGIRLWELMFKIGQVFKFWKCWCLGVFAAFSLVKGSLWSWQGQGVLWEDGEVTGSREGIRAEDENKQLINIMAYEWPV